MMCEQCGLNLYACHPDRTGKQVCEACWDEAQLEQDGMREREVCGSYEGAIPYVITSDESAEVLARRLANNAGCDYYTVDGITVPRAVPV